MLAVDIQPSTPAAKHEWHRMKLSEKLDRRLEIDGDQFETMPVVKPVPGTSFCERVRKGEDGALAEHRDSVLGRWDVEPYGEGVCLRTTSLRCTSRNESSGMYLAYRCGAPDLWMSKNRSKHTVWRQIRIRNRHHNRRIAYALVPMDGGSEDLRLAWEYPASASDAVATVEANGDKECKELAKYKPEVVVRERRRRYQDKSLEDFSNYCIVNMFVGPSPPYHLSGCRMMGPRYDGYKWY
jgi:hypothetical protein